MSTSTLDATAVDVSVDEHDLRAALRDGRTISVPLTWFPRLASASAEARETWHLIGGGEGIHCEDLSVAGLLRVA